MEHRWGERRPIDFVVKFVMMPATVGTGHIVNISSTGAFMRTQIILRHLSLLYLQPMESPENENNQVGATVVRLDATGVGLEWCEYGAKTMKYLPLATPLQHLADDPRSQILTMASGLPVSFARKPESSVRR
jgi:hypothetical protein